MRQLAALLVAILIFTTTPALILAVDTLPNPEVLTEEAILTGTRLSTYDTIIINDFKTEATVYTNVDDEEKPKVDAMKSMLVKGLTDSLELELKKRKLFKTIEKNTVPTGKALILEGGFTEFNAGNRAVRFWVGFGAGKTYLKAQGHLVDAQTGKELATFVERETGYKGTMTMENFEGLFPSQAMSMGENIAEFIQKLY